MTLKMESDDEKVTIECFYCYSMYHVLLSELESDAESVFIDSGWEVLAGENCCPYCCLKIEK